MLFSTDIQQTRANPQQQFQAQHVPTSYWDEGDENLKHLNCFKLLMHLNSRGWWWRTPDSDLFVLSGTGQPMNVAMDVDMDTPPVEVHPNRSWCTMDTQTERPRQAEIELDQPTTLQGTYFQYVSKYPVYVSLSAMPLKTIWFCSFSIDVTECNANEHFHLSCSFATRAGKSEHRTYQVCHSKFWFLSPQWQ